VGEEDHVDHSVCCAANKTNVYDFTDDLEPAVAFNGTDSTTAFAARAVALLRAQAALGADAPPLFLYVAFQDTHVPLEAPPELIARCMANNATGGDTSRATICGMALLLDEAIGNITAVLAETGLDKNTILIAHSDNGGPVEGGFFNNNFPLRGGKASLWQGGVRSAGVMAGPGVPSGGAHVAANVHITDWLPSLVSAATGGEDFRKWAPPGEPPYELGDGVDVWTSLVRGEPSPREWVLLETAHGEGGSATHGFGLIQGQWKIVAVTEGSPDYENGWWPPAGQDVAMTPYSVACNGGGGGGAPPRVGPAPVGQCKFPTPCLFDLATDPCEYNDVAAAQPDVLAQMQAALANFTRTAVRPGSGSGCMPRLIKITGSTGGAAFAWRPCDAPPPAGARP
jgi:arylsulfatase I/J